MKQLHMCTAVVLVVLLISVQADDASADTYDLGADWSDTANPNGPWSYNGWDGLITTHVDDWNSQELGLGQPAWASWSSDGYLPCWFKSTKTYLDFLPGDIVTHNSHSGPSHITWTSPMAGTVEQIINGDTGGGNREEAHRCEDGIAAAHIIRNHKTPVSFLI